MQIPEAELYWGSHPKLVGIFDNIDIGPWLSSYNLGIQTHKIGIKILSFFMLCCPRWEQFNIKFYIFLYPQYILLNLEMNMDLEQSGWISDCKDLLTHFPNSSPNAP